MIKADCHVHFYDCYSPEFFLEAAKTNLGRDGVLFFTHRFGVEPDWKSIFPKFEVLSDGVGLIDGITFVRGYQIVSQERIEILNLAGKLIIEDGLKAKDILSKIDGVPVIPWSPGKWLGARGRLIKSLAKDVYCGRILYREFLADFTQFRGILSGSDPLNRPNEEKNVGRIGVVGEGKISSLDQAKQFLVSTKQQFGSQLTTVESVFRYILC